MKLTRRGYATLAVTVAAVLSAGLFGARGLNAIAAPAAVALVYGAVQVWRLDDPSLERNLPDRGEQGTTVTVELEVDTDRPHSARLRDAIGEGLEATGHDREVSLGAGPVEYELFLRRRGEHAVGPATIESRDVLGLVSRTAEVGGTTRVLVRPPVYPLSGSRADEIVWLFGGGDDRQEFDFLRHYRRGDPLRDIHWRTSAKVPSGDFVVKEFSTDEGVTSVRLAGESEAGYDDEMAAATASVAVHLLGAGLRVGVATGDVRLAAQGGLDQREQVLDTLARTRGGSLRARDRDAADVVVAAGPSGVTVELAEAVAPFSQVAGREVSVPSRYPGEGGATARPGGLS